LQLQFSNWGLVLPSLATGYSLAKPLLGNSSLILFHFKLALSSRLLHPRNSEQKRLIIGNTMPNNTVYKDGERSYYLIFRWFYKNKQGKIIRAKRRPFPIKIFL